MFNVNIYDKNWIDLVFENKNKAYGAYQMRLENPKTTMMALLAGVMFLFTVTGLGVFLSSFNAIPVESLVPPIDVPTIALVHLAQKSEAKSEKPKTIASPVQSTVQPTNLSHMVVAPTLKADISPSVQTTQSIPTDSQGMGTGGESTIAGGGNGTSTILNLPATDTKPNTVGELDHLPEYPGGINKFYEYVGNNIDRPDYDENLSVSMLTVIMSFVIEKDGTMTDIKVLRSTDKNLEKAAIKVLKSLKAKWRPGIKDGENVRTLYMLPIKVKM